MLSQTNIKEGLNNQGNQHTYTYKVAMLGYESVSGVLMAPNKCIAEQQAVLLFCQENDIAPEPLLEAVKFYAPKVKQVR